MLLQTIGGEAALLPETREDVISTGIVTNFHALSLFMSQLHAAVKSIGDAEAKAAREHERLAAICSPFSMELPFSASISTLGRLHSVRAAHSRGIYGLYQNLSIEEKARRISSDVRPLSVDTGASESVLDAADSAAGQSSSTSIASNLLPTPYGKLEALLSALISGPLFSIGRYATRSARAHVINAALCRYRLVYRDAHRDATIQHVRVSKMKEGDKHLEAEVRLLHERMCA